MTKTVHKTHNKILYKTKISYATVQVTATQPVYVTKTKSVAYAVTKTAVNNNYVTVTKDCYSQNNGYRQPSNIW